MSLGKALHLLASLLSMWLRSRIMKLSNSPFRYIYEFDSVLFSRASLPPFRTPLVTVSLQDSFRRALRIERIKSRGCDQTIWPQKP